MVTALKVFFPSSNYGVIMVTHIFANHLLFTVFKNNTCRCNFKKLGSNVDEKQSSTVSNPQSDMFSAEAAVCEFRMSGWVNGIYCSPPLDGDKKAFAPSYHAHANQTSTF